MTYLESVDRSALLRLDRRRRASSSTKHSFCHRFTPRKSGSHLEQRQRRPRRRPRGAGLMHPAGLAAFAARSPGARAPLPMSARPSPVLSAALAKKFRAAKSAWKFFEAQPRLPATLDPPGGLSQTSRDARASARRAHRGFDRGPAHRLSRYEARWGRASVSSIVRGRSSLSSRDSERSASTCRPSDSAGSSSLRSPRSGCAARSCRMPDRAFQTSRAPPSRHEMPSPWAGTSHPLRAANAPSTPPALHPPPRAGGRFLRRSGLEVSVTGESFAACRISSDRHCRFR